MRTWDVVRAAPDEGETLAAFGEARLIKFIDGNLELRGGPPEDRKAAMKWVETFMPDAVFPRGRD